MTAVRLEGPLGHQELCDVLPTQNAEQISQTALGTTEGYLVDRSGKCPVDIATGLPLPIAPVFDMNALSPDDINEHHHFYPRLSPVLRDTSGGRALRVSRIQRVAKIQHNFGDKFFHKYFPEGPDIPFDPLEQLGLCVLACAGYLPTRVVDTQGGEPAVRDMLPWELGRLQRPGSYLEPLPMQVKRFRDRRYPDLTLREAKDEMISSRKKQAGLSYQNLLYGFDPMKKFMSEEILGLDFSEVKPRTIRGFLEKKDVGKGLTILAIGAKLVAERATVQGRPLEKVYDEQLRAGRINHLMPQSPSTLIKNKLGAVEHRVELLNGLKLCLEAQRDNKVA
jgi:hypothetical protein